MHSAPRLSAPQRLALALWWAPLSALLEAFIHARPTLHSSELARLALHVVVAALAWALVSVSAHYTTGALSAEGGARRRLGRLTRALIAHPALTFGVWGWWLGVNLSQGDWAQAQSWVDLFPYGLSVAFVVGAALFIWLTRAPRGGLGWWVLLIGSLSLQLLDLTQLRSLYPTLHASLYALSALLGVAVLSASPRPQLQSSSQPPARPLVLPLALTLSSALLLAWVALEPTGLERAALNHKSPRAQLLPARPLKVSERVDWARLSDHLKALNAQALKAEAQGRAAAERLATLESRRKEGQQSKARPLDVVLIIVDTLRFDALYHELLAEQPKEARTVLSDPQDTPFINQWRQDRAHSFLNAYTQASRTKLSIPGTFMCTDPTTRYKARGLHVAERFERAGYQTFALTEEYFVFPIRDGGDYLINPFERTWHFTEDKQHHALPLWEELLEARAPERPMMAWVHLYMMHAPYFAGEKRMTRRDGSAHERYKMALQTLDKHLKGLIGSLERRDALDHTLIAITSDHGEGLGDHNVDGHGSSVFEEQVRTPFLIYDPRLKELPLSARTHHEVVGNVDLVPTLSALAGLPSNPLDHGHALTSLLSRLQERAQTGELTWPYSYTLANGNAGMRGVVTQARHKLTLSPRRGVSSLYDLSADPRERHDVSGGLPEVARDLTLELATLIPKLATPKGAEERAPVAQALIALVDKLGELSVELTRRLLLINEQLKSGALFKALAAHLSLKGQLWVASAGLEATPKPAQQLLKRALSTLTPNELTAELLALSHTQPPPFGQTWLPPLIQPTHEPSALAWLTLTRDWDSLKPAELTLVSALGERALSQEGSLRLREALLARLSSLTLKRGWPKGAQAATLVRLVEDLLARTLEEQASLSVRARAAAARLAKRHAKRLSAPLRRSLSSSFTALLDTEATLTLKKLSLYTLFPLALTPQERGEVRDALIKASEQRLILVPIIEELGRLADAKSVRFIKRQKRRARTNYARVSAKKTLKRIAKRKRRAQKRKRKASKRKAPEPKAP